MSTWQIRGIQLDLARQRETVDFIKQFTSFASEWGYNLLLLYLEGVVRTEHFPFRPADQSYTLDEMAEVVAHARTCGIEVVPCINTLGHAEHFMNCPEMDHVSGKANFGGPMFNPAVDATYEFLENYLGEIASVFPSSHFHIGCDEAWALGRTSECIARLDAGETYADLFSKHLVRTRDIVDKLGKRAWIWSDLLEYFSDDEIAALPRDIVMCSWHYSAGHIDQSGIRGHFDNLLARDWFGLYERLGFDVLACPAVGARVATENLTRVAREHPVLGGVHTMWELSAAFVPALMPDVALTGHMWSNPSLTYDEVSAEVLPKVLPNLDSHQRNAVQVMLCEASAGESPMQALSLPVGKDEHRAYHNANLRVELLNDVELAAADPLEREMIADLQLRSQAELLQRRIRRHLRELADPRITAGPQNSHRAELEHCRAELADLADDRADQWQRLRPGIGPDHASAAVRAQLATFDELLASLEGDARPLLILDLFLYENYSAPRLVVERWQDDAWQEVWAGMCKPADLQRSAYQRHLRLDGPLDDAVKLRLTASGFGGQGVSYLAIHHGGNNWVPEEVAEVVGQVANAEHVLTNNSWICFLGSQDTVNTLMTRSDEDASSVEVTLHKSNS